MGDDVISRVEDVPMIVYWKGVPISDLPREELEREFCAAHQRIAELQDEICNRSIAHVHDLARAAKQRLRDKHPVVFAIRKALDHLTATSACPARRVD